MSKQNCNQKYFIIDDTIREVTGKLVEGASYVYDHTKGHCVLGFQKLVLGVFDGEHFLPVIQKNCSSKKTPNARSKATKYKKTPKKDRIDKKSPGAKERESLAISKLDKTFSMLKRARKKFESVEFVLFDSWFCFNSFLSKIKKTLNIDVICQLKNFPKTNQYLFDNKKYSLKQLYEYKAKYKMRKKRKCNYKQAVLTVEMFKTGIPLKIVFIQNNDQEKFHAFGCTKTNLSSKEILEHYSQRWSIEVFFKNCKQYLNYGKEQVSNIDSMVALDAIVFTRYIILTYIAFRNKTTFYESLEKCRKQKKFIDYGLRLLNYFFKKLTNVIEYIIEMLEKGLKDQAKELLREIVRSSKDFDQELSGLI